MSAPGAIAGIGAAIGMTLMVVDTAFGIGITLTAIVIEVLIYLSTSIKEDSAATKAMYAEAAERKRLSN